MIEEITAAALDAEKFIEEKTSEIRATVGDGIAINALSGGVDSSVVTMLGHRNGRYRRRSKRILCRSRGSHGSGGEEGSHYADLLQASFRAYRQGERGQISPPGYDSHGCR